MGYYIRVLGLDTRSFTTNDLNEIKGIIMENDGIDFDYQINGQNADGNLKGFIIKNKKGEDIADVSIDRKQRNLLDEEIEEFKEDIEEYVSQKNYDWLENYLDKVEIIYAFQVLSKGFEPKNWDIIYALHNTIWNGVGGIWQSDESQFSNEDGSVIMADWEDAKWTDAKDTQVALLNDNDTWDTFEIKSEKDFLRFIGE